MAMAVNNEFKGETRATLAAIADDIKEIRQQLARIEEKVDANSQNIARIQGGVRVVYAVAGAVAAFISGLFGFLGAKIGR